MTPTKLAGLLAVAAMPFLASCMTPNEKIARGLDEYSLTLNEAQAAIAEGAEISVAFLVKAAVRDNVAVVELFVAEGANPWEMKDATGTFSLFAYAASHCREALLKICFDTKALYPDLAEKKATEYVEFVISKLSQDPSLRVTNVCALIWEAGLALPTKAKMEAEQKRVAEEEARREKERIERERKEALETLKDLEIAALSVRMIEEVLAGEKKLSKEESSRGRVLIEAFGEEQMPALLECYKQARQAFLEADANLNELVAALRAEGVNTKLNFEILGACAKNLLTFDEFVADLKEEDQTKCIARYGSELWWQRQDVLAAANDIFQAAGNRWLDLAAEYWRLRYKLTDYYSLFKIGAITPDELAAKDAAFPEG